MEVVLGQSTVDILALGACAPGGMRALDLATAVRAKRFEPAYVYFDVPTDDGGHPSGDEQPADDRPRTRAQRVLMCSLPTLPDDCLGHERLLAMGTVALREACADTDAATAPLPLFLALAEAARPGAQEHAPDDIIDELSAGSNVRLDRRRSRIFREGHAGGASALAAAAELLESGRAKRALVGGIDSYRHPQVVAWLAREGFLQDDRGPEGFLPSEGAAFLLLGGEKAEGSRLARLCIARSGRVEQGALALFADLAEQAAKDSSDERPRPLQSAVRGKLGDALAAGPSDAWSPAAPQTNEKKQRKPTPKELEAQRKQEELSRQHAAARDVTRTMEALLAEVVESWPGVPAKWVLSDVNNAHSRVQEWQQVSRTALPLDILHTRLADQLGDLGAAAGPVLAAIVCTWWQIGCAPAPSALLALHSASAERGVALLKRVSLADASQTEPVAPASLGTPSRAQSSDPVRMAAAAWFDMLGQMLLAVSSLGDDDNPAALAAALDEAMAACEALQRTQLGDDRALDRLDRLIDRLDAAQRLFAGKRPLSEQLEGLRHKARQRRPQLIDEAVRLTATRQNQEGAPAALAAFRSSGQLPALHQLSSIRPGAFMQLSALAQVDEDSSVTPQRAAQRAAARSHLGAIGRASQLRSSADAFPWSPTQRSFDQALLHHLDAFAALGYPHSAQDDAFNPLEELVVFSRQSPADPTRAFVRTLLLGCQQGQAPMNALLLALRQSPEETHAAQAQALALASSPLVGPAMEQLCVDRDRRLVAIALDVLSARRSVSFAHVYPLLLHSAPGLRRKAAAALGHARSERDAVIAALMPLIDDEPDDQLVANTLGSLLILDVSAALERVRQLLRDDAGLGESLSRRAKRQLLVLLALSGAASDSDLLLESAIPDHVEALGWYGHAGSIEPLTALLREAWEAAPKRRRRRRRAAPSEAIARALQRITGATPPTTGLRHRRRPEVLNADPTFWEAWWQDHQSDFDLQQKYRLGRPFSLEITIDELSAAGVLADVRKSATLELLMLAGDAPVPWEEDWIDRQLDALEALRNVIRAAGSAQPPGQWPATQLGGRHRGPSG